MRYRRMTASGDYSFGHGSSDFLVNSSEAVAQAVLTRLRMIKGEYFVNVDEGTDYNGSILGKGTDGTRDLAFRMAITQTPGVEEILDYTGEFDPTTRKYKVTAKVSTVYGSIDIDTGVPL